MKLFDPETLAAELEEARQLSAPQSDHSNGHGDEQRPYTVPEAASVLGVSPQLVYRRVSEGRIRSRKVGADRGTPARTVIDPDALEAYVEAQKGACRAGAEQSPPARALHPAPGDQEIVSLLRELVSEVRSLKQHVVLRGS